jgi:hypothetical protein
MSIRYIYNVALALAAGFLVVATQSFTAGTIVALVFAISVGATVLSAAVIPFRIGLVQRALAAVALVIGAWTIVASLVFSDVTVKWLGFSSALALVGLAFIGLTAHELRTERVVHSLEVARGSEAAKSGEPLVA